MGRFRTLTRTKETLNYTQYNERIDENVDSLKLAMKKDYARVVKNMSTEHESFRFKQIMNSYRPGMNPVRALYYQTRDVIRRYNPEHPYHYWLIDLVTDLKILFVNTIVTVLLIIEL